MPEQEEVRYVDTGITVDHAYDLDGREYDDAYVEEIAERTRTRRGGRPSLTGEAKISPRLQLRVTPSLDNAITRAAADANMTKADWMRSVLSIAAVPKPRRAASRQRRRPAARRS